MVSEENSSALLRTTASISRYSQAWLTQMGASQCQGKSLALTPLKTIRKKSRKLLLEGKVPPRPSRMKGARRISKKASKGISLGEKTLTLMTPLEEAARMMREATPAVEGVVTPVTKEEVPLGTVDLLWGL